MPDWVAGHLCAQWQPTRGRLFTTTATTFVLIAAVSAAGFGADAELGRYLSSECMTCHGTAKHDSTIPNIFGLGQARFVAAVKAYRDKALPNQVMQTIASRLSDDDIAALALYFESAKKAK